MKNLVKNKYLFLIALIALLASSCNTNFGQLEVKVVGQSSVSAGEAVSYKLTVPEGTEVTKVKVTVFDEDEQIVVNQDLDGKLEYTFKASTTGKYKIEFYVETPDDYGYAKADLEVKYNGWQPQWGLAENTNNLLTVLPSKDGIVPELVLYLDPVCNDERVHSVNAKLIRLNDKNGEVLVYKKDIKDGKFNYQPEPNKFGNIKIIVELVLKDGHTVKVDDIFTILDPNNPVAITPKASVNDSNLPDSIKVTGKVTSEGEPLVALELVRISYYGKEVGCEPLMQPNVPDAGDPANFAKFYNKAGMDYLKNETVYKVAFSAPGVVDESVESPLKYNAADGTFEFIDPMPYYIQNDKGGEIESEGFKWNYARVDREAWKAIKRKKNFDLETAFGVEYVVRAGIADKPLVNSISITGIPYLSTIPMAQFCMWAKEVAMNRLWHMQVPRYGWSQTINYIGKGQDVPGNISGKAHYDVNIGSRTGNGYIKDYCDWPGLKLYSNQNIVQQVALGDHIKQKHSVDLTIETSIWGKILFKIDNLIVRDYVLQWGAWIDKKGAPCVGNLIISRNGKAKETVTGEQIASFIPTYEYNKSGADAYTQEIFTPGYGYEKWDAGPGDPVKAWANVATWTKIHFKHAPTPTDIGEGVGNWNQYKAGWSIKYEVE